MYTECGDNERCVKTGVDFTHKVWDEILEPYHKQAKDLVSLSTPPEGRRNLWRQVGGCPVCVLQDRDALSQYLINSVCCHEHGAEIGKWISSHMKPGSSISHLCKQHKKGADEAWLLVRSENWIEIPATGENLNIGHVAFAFKRPVFEQEIWPKDSVWVWRQPSLASRSAFPSVAISFSMKRMPWTWMPRRSQARDWW